VKDNSDVTEVTDR